MVNIPKTILVNEEDWKYLKSLNVSLSSEIRDFLKQLRSIKDADIDGINVELERIKLKKNIAKMEKTQLEIKKSEDILKKHGEIQQKKLENQLKKDKDRIEKETKCPSCDGILEKKGKIEIRDGVFLCKPCYHTVDIKKFL